MTSTYAQTVRTASQIVESTLLPEGIAVHVDVPASGTPRLYLHMTPRTLLGPIDPWDVLGIATRLQPNASEWRVRPAGPGNANVVSLGVVDGIDVRMVVDQAQVEKIGVHQEASA